MNGISLDLYPGECFAVLGRNGSGKSTLTRLLLGLERPTSGTITVLGNTSTCTSKKHLASTGVALDTSCHWEQLTGRDNAFFVARSYGISPVAIERRLDELFTMAEMSETANDPVKNYSFGMRRKLSLIESLCHDPELLVLDEPTTGVDVQFLVQLTSIIKQRTERGRITWIAGNDPDWIEGIATKVAFMESGKFIEIDSVESLIGNVSPYQEITVILDKLISIPSPDTPEIHSYIQNGETITALVDKIPGHVPKLMDWIVSHEGTIKSVEVHHSTLRDAYLLATGRTLQE
ncbi:ABC transporter ATP-binding protein [Candidatus Latescibacterota bacterium]